MTHAERVDEPLERDFTPRSDRVEQVADRNFAETFMLLQLDLRIALLKREDVGRLLYPALLKEQRDLLFPQPVDIERAAGDEMLQMLNFLRRTGKLASAAGNHALLTTGRRVAHHGGVQRARAATGKSVRLCRFRTPLPYYAQHLRDDVAGTLDHHGVADAHPKPVDLIGVVQRGVLHHDPADSHRLQTRNRRERAGATNVDIDRFYDSRRFLGWKLVRNCPARIARDEAEPLLPVQAVDLVDDAVDVVIQRCALRLDFVMKCEHRVD